MTPTLLYTIERATADQMTDLAECTLLHVMTALRDEHAPSLTAGTRQKVRSWLRRYEKYGWDPIRLLPATVTLRRALRYPIELYEGLADQADDEMRKGMALRVCLYALRALQALTPLQVSDELPWLRWELVQRVFGPDLVGYDPEVEAAYVSAFQYFVRWIVTLGQANFLHFDM